MLMFLFDNLKGPFCDPQSLNLIVLKKVEISCSLQIHSFGEIIADLMAFRNPNIVAYATK